MIPSHQPFGSGGSAGASPRPKSSSPEHSRRLGPASLGTRGDGSHLMRPWHEGLHHLGEGLIESGGGILRVERRDRSAIVERSRSCEELNSFVSSLTGGRADRPGRAHLACPRRQLARRLVLDPRRGPAGSCQPPCADARLSARRAAGQRFPRGGTVAVRPVLSRHSRSAGCERSGRALRLISAGASGRSIGPGPAAASWLAMASRAGRGSWSVDRSAARRTS